MGSKRDPRYRTARWRRAARAAIERSGGRCEIRHDERCLGAATECDHVRSPLLAASPPEADYLFWSPDNHRAACKPCNARTGAIFGAKLARRRRYTPSRSWP